MAVGLGREGRVSFRLGFQVVSFLSVLFFQFSFGPYFRFVSLCYLVVYIHLIVSLPRCDPPPSSLLFFLSPSPASSPTRRPLSHPQFLPVSRKPTRIQTYLFLIDRQKAKTQENKEREKHTKRFDSSSYKNQPQLPSFLISTRPLHSSPRLRCGISTLLLPTGRLLPTDSGGPRPPPLNGSRGSFPSRGRLRLSPSVVSSVKISSVVVSIPVRKRSEEDERGGKGKEISDKGREGREGRGKGGEEGRRERTCRLVGPLFGRLLA